MFPIPFDLLPFMYDVSFGRETVYFRHEGKRARMSIKENELYDVKVANEWHTDQTWYMAISAIRLLFLNKAD